MLTVRRLPATGMAGTVVLLAALWATRGLSGDGWVVGLSCGVGVTTVVGVALRRAGSHGAGPADLVTLTRAVLTCAVAALAADSLLHHVVASSLVPLTVVALVLDAVDGWVARRTGTCSAFGGRFDGEVDAFLILVLSVYVAPTFGAWILSAGLVRYVFGAAGWVLPWMRGLLGYRYWRKVVTAVQGIVLAFAAADVAPRWLALSGLVVGLALLAESFGRDVVWLWRRRGAEALGGATVGATIAADVEGDFAAGVRAAVVAPARPRPRVEQV
jgi:phosphatidylglycerophosphate synthase